MTLEEIVRDWLSRHGYDGLCYPEEECGCGIDDLMPCSQPSLNCVAGYKEDDGLFYPGRKEE
mgnify:CR=1 FL=1